MSADLALLYDFERDGPVAEGEALLTLEDGSSERCKESDLEPAPRDYDLKALIRKEHHRAEFERLRAGDGGCGCGLCQAFYTTLDLSVFGDRVKRFGDLVYVVEGVTGAELWGKYHRNDRWVGADQINIICGQGYAVAPDGKTLFMGAEDEITEALKTGKIPETATPAQKAEYERVFTLMVKRGVIKNGGQADRAIPTKRTYQSGIRKARSERSRPVLDVRRRPAGPRRVAAAKRLPDHLPQPKLPGLSDWPGGAVD